MAQTMTCPAVAMSRSAMGSTRLASRAAFAPLPAARISRRSLIVRAEKSGLDKLADKVEEKAQELVEATKENSGLNLDNLNQQPGQGSGLGTNKTKEAGVPDAMSFSGLLPEIINGRAAMWAMLAAFGAEARTGHTVFQQVQEGPLSIAVTFGIIILASVIPLVRGADLNRNGWGPFTQRAEVWNGRLAMVAFALLLTVETWKAGPGLRFF